MACQLTLKAGLVAFLNPTTVGFFNPTPPCPGFGTVLFCIETVPKAGIGFLNHASKGSVGGRHKGLNFSPQKHQTLRARSRSIFYRIDPNFQIKIKHGVNYNWSIIYDDLSSLCTLTEPFFHKKMKTAQTANFESSVELLRELRSLYKMNQMYCTVVHSMFDLDL